MSLQLVPIDSELTSWSFADSLPPKHAGNVYFISIASIDVDSGMNVCLRLEPSTPGCDKPVVALGVSSFEMIDESKELAAFLKTLPAWVAPTAFVAAYRYIEV
jgi:hypothetical protein